MSNKNEEVLLSVQHLRQYFPMGKNNELKAVDDVSFDIKRGEVFGLVGESGCGKTTTGRSIIRLYNCTGGDVYFKGRRICAGIRQYEEKIQECKDKLKTATGAEKDALQKEIDEQKSLMKKAKFDHKNTDKMYMEETGDKHPLSTKIQMIFQDPVSSINPRMTVREIIAEGLRIQGEKNEKVIEDRVFELLELVGLVKQHADRYPHEFSGGQRQRIGIARALALKPELIIADEPISALDVSIQAQVINLLNDLRKTMGLTIMFIAHDLSVVKYFSDRIGVMYFGNLVELADADELFKHPVHPYTKSLLSAIPLPDPHYEKNRKRIAYNPATDHLAGDDKAELRDCGNGHFVKCNLAEFEKYKAIINEK